MFAGMISALMQIIVNAPVDQHRTGGAGMGRGYYNWVITGLACFFPPAFLAFTIASIPAVVSGESGAWQFVLIGSAGLALMGPMVALQIIRREAVWDAKGVRFR